MAQKWTTKTVTKAAWEFTCDRCGKGMASESCKKCAGCERDTCEACRHYWYTDPFDGFDYGDYPKAVCHDCSLKVRDYEAECVMIRQVAETKVEAKREQWKLSVKITK